MSYRRSGLYRRMINSARWQRLRNAVLRDSCGLCFDCRQLRRLNVAATEVHHIEPVEWITDAEKMERRMFDPSNLVALCHRCHVQRHKELHSHDRRRTGQLNRARLLATLDALETPEQMQGIDKTKS